MNAPTERRAKRRLARSRAFLPALLCLLPLGTASPAGADTPQNSQNTIVSIRTVLTPGGPTTYGITLNSSVAFPMDDSIVTLSIGGKEFINSIYAPGGTLNSLVFTLTQSEFQSLKSGASVVIYDGEQNAAIPEAQWNFGNLDLSLLDLGIRRGRPLPVVGLPVPIIGTPVTAPPMPMTIVAAPATVSAPMTVTLTAAVKTMAGMTDKAMTITAKIARKGHK